MALGIRWGPRSSWTSANCSRNNAIEYRSNPRSWSFNNPRSRQLGKSSRIKLAIIFTLPPYCSLRRVTLTETSLTKSQRAAGKFCGITHDQSRPLSRHPSIIQWIVERLAQTISHHRVDPRRTAVVMVGRGSYSPCAQADMRILSELVRHRMAMSHMHTAFYAMAEPRLPDVLNQVAENSELETVIVHPHLLFHGQLFESISHQTTEASERFPALRWLLSGDLRPNKGVANAVHFRVFGRGNLVSAAKNAGFSNIAADETRPGAIKLDSARNNRPMNKA